jgi:hypothetical protein
VVRVAFQDDSSNFTRCLWRQAKGCREYAFDIIQGHCLHYGIIIDDEIFDEVCARMIGGVEVEWDHITYQESSMSGDLIFSRQKQYNKDMIARMQS